MLLKFEISIPIAQGYKNAWLEYTNVAFLIVFYYILYFIHMCALLQIFVLIRFTEKFAHLQLHNGSSSNTSVFLKS